MRIFSNPGLWAHPGHGGVQGLAALIFLLVAAPAALIWSAASRLRGVLVPVPVNQPPPGRDGGEQGHNRRTFVR